MLCVSILTTASLHPARARSMNLVLTILWENLVNRRVCGKSPNLNSLNMVPLHYAYVIDISCYQIKNSPLCLEGELTRFHSLQIAFRLDMLACATLFIVLSW